MFSDIPLLANYQKALLEHLFYVCQILEKNNIWYSLSSGTLLGAIREKGFINWDDDVDIMIKYEDQEIVKEVLKSINNKHELRIINDSYLKTWDKRYEVIFKDKKIGHPTLDIFCIAPVDLRKINYFKWQFYRVISFASLGESHASWEIPTIAKIPQFFNKYFFFFVDFKKIHNRLLKKVLTKNFSNEIYTDVANFSWVKNEWFTHDSWKTKKILFENYLLNVATNHLEILDNHYGKNWKTPHKKRPLTKTHSANRIISVERVDFDGNTK